MRRAALLAAPLLAACASGAQMQAECEAKHREFPAIFQCTYDAVAQNKPSALQDPRAKLYLLRGEQLAEQVRRGEMSSLDARVAWQRLYLQLKDQHDAEVAATLAVTARAIEASRPPPPPPSITCTSTPSGGNSVVTNCR